MRYEMNLGSTLLTFVAGAATGAAVALLLAPKNGRQNREALMGLGGDAKDLLQKVPGLVSGAASAITGAVQDKLGSAEEVAYAAQQKLQGAQDRATSIAAAVRNGSKTLGHS